MQVKQKPKQPTSLQPFHVKESHSDMLPRQCQSNNTNFLTFLLSNFRYYFTLFSKFFSSFLHSTCSLSVSHQYLALDGIYHPIWTAFPSNSTRRIAHVQIVKQYRRDYHPLWFTLPRRLTVKLKCKAIYRLQFQKGFTRWALPASLAVTRGILVSFFSSA